MFAIVRALVFVFLGERRIFSLEEKIEVKVHGEFSGGYKKLLRELFEMSIRVIVCYGVEEQYSLNKEVCIFFVIVISIRLCTIWTAICDNFK